MKNKPPITRREFMKFGAIVGALATMPKFLLDLEIPKEEAEKHLIPMLSDGKWHKVEYGKFSNIERLAIDGKEIEGVAREFPDFLDARVGNFIKFEGMPKDNYVFSCYVMLKPDKGTYLDDLFIEG